MGRLPEGPDGVCADVIVGREQDEAADDRLRYEHAVVRYEHAVERIPVKIGELRDLQRRLLVDGEWFESRLPPKPWALTNGAAEGRTISISFTDWRGSVTFSCALPAGAAVRSRVTACIFAAACNRAIWPAVGGCGEPIASHAV